MKKIMAFLGAICVNLNKCEIHRPSKPIFQALVRPLNVEDGTQKGASSTPNRLAGCSRASWPGR